MYAARVDALERHVGTLPPDRLVEHLVAEIGAQQVAAPGLFGRRYGRTAASSPGCTPRGTARRR
ncbi:hypothetical protein [Cellulosimicrobium cellulans]|uniref:hypothetical protein n=1 Tax=Cellulosimicrobium cellulans TaxID=1710 RepID=UPI0021CB7368|nr:hypothetical protein [Cellulosimicrobium cellulans]